MGTPTVSQLKKGFDSKFEAGVAISNEKTDKSWCDSTLQATNFLMSVLSMLV